MIISTFDVQSGGKDYTFVDRVAVDNGEERERIQQFIMAQLSIMQQDAMCEAIGIQAVTEFEALGFGVYDRSDLIGVFLIAALAHQSGVWRDPHNGDWEVINSDPVIFFARPMPGFVALPESVALDLSVDSAYHFLAQTLISVGGHDVKFGKLSWAIFKGRTDANSRMAKKIHDYAAVDARFKMTETIDQTDVSRTLVDIELK
jgi:hypothetical protein